MKKAKPRYPGLYLKHGLWTWQPSQRGGVKSRRVHLGTTDFSEAVQMVETLKASALEAKAVCPLDAEVNAFLNEKQATGEHHGRGTKRAASPALNRLKKRFRCTPDRITTADIETWKTELLASNLSRASVKSYLSYAQSFFSWLEKKGKIRRSPFAGKAVKTLKSIPTRRERHCSRMLRDFLIASCAHRDLQALLAIGFHTGMRISEILNLRPEWIVTNERGAPQWIRVQNEEGGFTIKDKDTKFVPVNDWLACFLIRYGWNRGPYVVRPEKLPGKHFLRWESRRNWAAHMNAVGCPWVTPHVMRHTYITLMFSAPPTKRPSESHLERWTGTQAKTLRKHYAHLIEDRNLINAAI